VASDARRNAGVWVRIDADDDAMMLVCANGINTLALRSHN
jgi:hypothetical protein